MRRFAIVAGIALVAVLAGCGAHEPKEPSIKPVALQPSTTTSAASSDSPAPLTADNVYGRSLAAIKTMPGMSGQIFLTITEAGGSVALTGNFFANFQDPQTPTYLLQLTQDSGGTHPARVEIRAIGKEMYFIGDGGTPVHFSPQLNQTSKDLRQQQLIDAIAVGNLSPFQYPDLLEDTPLEAGRGGRNFVFSGRNPDADHADDELSEFLNYSETIDWANLHAHREFTLQLDEQSRPAGSRVTYTLPTGTTIDVRIFAGGYSGAKTTAPAP